MQTNHHQKRTKGFTLIELLVVIAIIGLLASIVLVALNQTRTKARDARRKADLKQIQLALEMYYDSNGRYPSVAGWVYSTAGGEWIPGLGAYMSKIPVDPKNNASSPWVTGNYSYTYGWNVGAGACPGYPLGNCSGQTYDLMAQLESATDGDRCYNKCYLIHTFAAGKSWCNSGPGCGGDQNYSVQMYSDH